MWALCRRFRLKSKRTSVHDQLETEPRVSPFDVTAWETRLSWMCLSDPVEVPNPIVEMMVEANMADAVVYRRWDFESVTDERAVLRNGIELP